MGNVASINQTAGAIRLPNFCNLGIMLRSLVVVNLLFGAAAVARASTLSSAGFELLELAALGEPVLIVSLLALCAARRGFHALGYARSIALVAIFELVLTWGAWHAVQALFPVYATLSFPRLATLVLFATAVTLAYFDLRARALAPAIADARIQALQARIRPHFLYNSINAVISLIRSEPRRAERALEDMADLFRVLMSENRTLAPIADEVELARQYLAIESLRLGERLRVSWHIDGMPGDALVPPLMLQPLVENAVYHGIEPSPEGGEVTIDVRRDGPQIVMTLANPVPDAGRSPAGNKIAIANIRERLQLHFDAEASMKSELDGGRYRVTIRMPYLTAPA
ncbi:MAG TPA: sensor histidine kinase [Usitatibacter sp.]|nr:sensor histidine kinase [Usitatibacter sp.]